MAYTTALTIGPAHTLIQNTVYALPARSCIVNTTAALEESNDFTFAASSALTDGQYTSAAFVRCTTAAPIVSLKIS